MGRALGAKLEMLPVVEAATGLCGWMTGRAGRPLAICAPLMLSVSAATIAWRFSSCDWRVTSSLMRDSTPSWSTSCRLESLSISFLRVAIRSS